MEALKPPGQGPSSRSRRLPRDARREEFLDAAAALTLEKGLDAVTMEAVARRVGVSKTLTYAYFSDRYEMLVALFDRETSIIDEHLQAALEAPLPFEERLRHLCEVACDISIERGRLIGVLMHASLGDGRLAARSSTRSRAEERRIARVLTSEFGLADDVAAVEACLVLAMCQRVLGYVLEEPESRPTALDALVELTMRGLRGLAVDAPGDLDLPQLADRVNSARSSSTPT